MGNLKNSAIIPLSLFLIFIMAGQGVSAQRPQACIAGVCVDVEIVQSKEAMMRGLSSREGLGINRGMLFIFDTANHYGFWMKDMKFALDILWLDQDGRIVDMRQNLPPCAPDNCPIHTPAKLARYVLEVGAGFTAGHRIKPGDTCQLKDLPG